VTAEIHPGSVAAFAGSAKMGNNECQQLFDQLIRFRKTALEPMNDRVQKRIISEALPIRESLKMRVILRHFDSAYSKVLAVKGAEKRI
jgi:hypothetical protein